MSAAKTVSIQVDGDALVVPSGITVAAALLDHGCRRLRRDHAGQPRGLYCGMGVCFDCIAGIDGEEGVRACMTIVRNGMKVTTS